MGPFVDCGSRFVDCYAATPGVVPGLIRYRRWHILNPNDVWAQMTKRGDKMRDEILGVLRSAGSAMSAYDVLRQLRASHPKIAPPTVYNALAVLTNTGRAHRVESLKAYIACQCDGSHQAAVLSICDECGTVEERTAPGLVENLTGFVEETGFLPQRHVIEVHGVCSSCGSGT